MNEIKISSISEYFAAVEKYKLNDFISRGEPKKHDEIMASAFRPYKKHKVCFGKNELDEFYNHIGNELSDMQKEHFLAFAQHSGLPTYLIDFTTSPLISLFFACYDSDSNNSVNGYVYFLNKSRLFSLDKLIINGYSGGLFVGEGSNIMDIWEKRFFSDKSNRHYKLSHPDFLNNYKIMICSFLDFIIYQELDFNNTDMYNSLSEICKRLTNTINGIDSFDELNIELYDAISKIIDTFNNGDIIEDIVRANGIIARYRDYDGAMTYYTAPSAWSSDPFDEMPSLSWQTVISDLFNISMEFALYSTQNNFHLPFYGTYSPPNISGRVLMQNSIFLCQIHNTELRHLNEPHPRSVLTTQKIEPDIMIEINNKKQVLNELDTLGFNLKTIYGDHDNIARYIKDKLYNKETVNTDET